MPTIIKNGRNYSGTSVSLTQAEYDALPEVTKMNGTTYFITDSEVVLNAEDVALDEGNLNDLAGSVATIETSPATTNHDVGEYILWNGVLYTVISAIATGENLVINSNISVRTIGSELQALNTGLTDLSEAVPTLASGWTQTQNRVQKRAGVCEVYIECIFSGTYSSGWNTIATLPEGYRPRFAFDTVQTDNANDSFCGVKIASGGAVQVYSKTGLSKNLRIHATYLAGN